MKYLVILNQSGGCDYTIGCGVKVLYLDATDKEKAYQQARELILEEHYSLESRIQHFTIVEYSDALSFQASIIYAQKAQEEQQKDDLEQRKLLAKLINKFGVDGGLSK